MKLQWTTAKNRKIYYDEKRILDLSDIYGENVWGLSLFIKMALS